MATSSDGSVCSSAEQVTDLSEAPQGHHDFYGFRCRIPWDEVEHLLGKTTDTAIAEKLGCSRRSVSRMRQRLGIPRFRIADVIRPLLGNHTDRVVAELRGCARETVTRQRLAEGIPRCPLHRKWGLMRARRALAQQKEK
jgi:hypothetical protein